MQDSHTLQAQITELRAQQRSIGQVIEEKRLMLASMLGPFKEGFIIKHRATGTVLKVTEVTLKETPNQPPRPQYRGRKVLSDCGRLHRTEQLIAYPDQYEVLATI